MPSFLSVARRGSLGKKSQALEKEMKRKRSVGETRLTRVFRWEVKQQWRLIWVGLEDSNK